MMTPLAIKFDSFQLTDEQFFQLCQDNRDLKFERNVKGDLIVMPPTGGETGERNSEINFQLRLWNKQYTSGKVFDSPTGFKLPEGAERSPDAAWITLEKWNALTPQQQQKFFPLYPDFVIELPSLADRLEDTQQKMREYLDSGTRLGISTRNI